MKTFIIIKIAEMDPMPRLRVAIEQNILVQLPHRVQKHSGQSASKTLKTFNLGP
jgi:hypothetical protein